MKIIFMLLIAMVAFACNDGQLPANDSLTNEDQTLLLTASDDYEAYREVHKNKVLLLATGQVDLTGLNLHRGTSPFLETSSLDQYCDVSDLELNEPTRNYIQLDCDALRRWDKLNVQYPFIATLPQEEQAALRVPDIRPLVGEGDLNHVLDNRKNTN